MNNFSMQICKNLAAVSSEYKSTQTHHFEVFGTNFTPSKQSTSTNRTV